MKYTVGSLKSCEVFFFIFQRTAGREVPAKGDAVVEIALRLQLSFVKEDHGALRKH